MIKTNWRSTTSKSTESTLLIGFIIFCLITSWPSGHPRFRYIEHEDGLHRLQMVRFQSVELTERLQQQDTALQDATALQQQTTILHQQDTTLQQQDAALQDGTHDTAAGSSYDTYNNNNNDNKTILPSVIGGVANEKENLPSGMDNVLCGGQMESVSWVVGTGDRHQGGFFGY